MKSGCRWTGWSPTWVLTPIPYLSSCSSQDLESSDGCRATYVADMSVHEPSGDSHTLSTFVCSVCDRRSTVKLQSCRRFFDDEGVCRQPGAHLRHEALAQSDVHAQALQGLRRRLLRAIDPVARQERLDL